jgi:hypothetical protein
MNTDSLQLDEEAYGIPNGWIASMNRACDKFCQERIEGWKPFHEHQAEKQRLSRERKAKKAAKKK